MQMITQQRPFTIRVHTQGTVSLVNNGHAGRSARQSFCCHQCTARWYLSLYTRGVWIALRLTLIIKTPSLAVFASQISTMQLPGLKIISL